MRADTAFFLAVSLGLAGTALAQSSGREEPGPAGDTAPAARAEAFSAEQLKAGVLGLLPKPVSDGLEFDLWGWLGGTITSHQHSWDGEFSFGLTKSFAQRVALSMQLNIIDANDDRRVELEQGYASAKLDDEGSAIFTLGKFNANFGLEARDFWDRRTGTTSLLFGAQPQDLVGGMLTLSLFDSTIKLRPFISVDFQGQFEFNQPISGGAMLEYRPGREFDLGVTNWVGPGVVLFGGQPLRHPYSQSAYGSDPDGVIGNWQGPNLVGERAGTLYFMEAKANWRPREDTTISAAYLLGTTGSESHRWGWQGFLVMGDFSLTDRLHLTARWSYLDDQNWLITGYFQTRQEISVSAGWEFVRNVEVRAEYRHDFSTSTPDTDIGSIHLTFRF